MGCQYNSSCEGMHCWACAIMVSDIAALIVFGITFVIGLIGFYQGGWICGFLNIIASLGSLAASIYIKCCQHEGGQQPSRCLGITSIIFLVLAVIGMFTLLNFSDMCKDVDPAYCTHSCAKCGTSGSGYSCDDGVDNGKASTCRGDSANGYIDCGRKWCWRADKDCEDLGSGDDDWHFWGFDSEDSCLEDYGDLRGLVGIVVALSLVMGVTNVVTRVGAAIAMCMCPLPEIPDPQQQHVQVAVGQPVMQQTGLQAVPMYPGAPPQGMVVQQGQLLQAGGAQQNPQPYALPQQNPGQPMEQPPPIPTKDGSAH